MFVVRKRIYFLVLFGLCLSLLAVFVSQAYAAITIDASPRWTGDLTITGALSKGSGSFVIDHPLDPENKLLYHSFVESPDVKNIYDGVVTLNDQGRATVTLPDYYEALNGSESARFLLTAIGESAPGLYVTEEGIYNNTFTIAGGPSGVRVSWQVTGIRQDPYILKNPIVVEVEKGPDALVDKGESINDIDIETIEVPYEQ